MPTLCGARWYRTVNGNLSVELGPPIADANGLARPKLTGFNEDDDAAELLLEGLSDAVSAPELVLVGRRSSLEVRLQLVRIGGGWSAVVRDDDLTVLGLETIDLFVNVPKGAVEARIRLASGVEFQSRHGAVRRWYATLEGNVSLRRPTPYESVLASGAFDVEYYLSQVPGLPDTIDPIEHYVTKGADQGLNPSRMFDTMYYRRMNPDLRRNYFAHYCDYGWKELRNPSPLFDTWWYWSKHMDLADNSVNPLAHYERIGKSGGLSTRPNPLPSGGLQQGYRFEEASHRVESVFSLAMIVMASLTTMLWHTSRNFHVTLMSTTLRIHSWLTTSLRSSPTILWVLGRASRKV